jgi:hypothetical protein
VCKDSAFSSKRQRFHVKMRQKYKNYRLFVAKQSIRRNKLKKKVADYLESDVFQRTFASDF